MNPAEGDTGRTRRTEKSNAK